MIIDIAGLPITIVRKKIKNMNLRIHAPMGDVTISAPHTVPLQAITDYLLMKHDWIQKARARVIGRTHSTTPTIQDGEQHYFLGDPYVLVIHTNAAHMKIDISGQYMNYFIKHGTEPARSMLFLQSWYKHHMLHLLPTLIQKWEPIIGVRVHAWGVRVMKTRWGSCNVVAKRISLNLTLMKKPLHCLEYVLVHEMVHLLEANHSHRFYALMDRFMPNWRSFKSILEL